MDTRFAITEYPDATVLNAELDALIKKPIYSISRSALKEYEEEYFAKKCKKSKEQIEEAKTIIPGGVQHNLAFNYPFPIVMVKAKGNRLYDVDGNEYYDFLQAGGPTIIGSNDDVVRDKVIELLEDCGPSTGLFHPYEYKLAKKISECVPSVEMFRMLGSGTEACMCAVRVARLATGHKNVIKMGGAYHGWADQLAFIEPCGPESATRPVDKDFPKGVQALCRKYGALLVCDEVVTGFRIGLSGAQGYYGIDPDITIFGKIIAGGYPGAGGIGGHREVMKYLGAGLDKSEGKKIHKAMCGGTMAATPISCCAGYTVICEIEKRNACQVAGQMADRLTKGINESIKKYDLPFICYNVGSICQLHTVATMQFSINWKKPWTIPNVLKQTGIRQTEMQYMGAAYMAEGLVTLAGSRLYTSSAYTEEDIDECIRRFDKVLSKCEKIDY